jgi:hypothetical protein
MQKIDSYYYWLLSGKKVNRSRLTSVQFNQAQPNAIRYATAPAGAARVECSRCGTKEMALLNTGDLIWPAVHHTVSSYILAWWCQVRSGERGQGQAVHNIICTSAHSTSAEPFRVASLTGRLRLNGSIINVEKKKTFLLFFCLVDSALFTSYYITSCLHVHVLHTFYTVYATLVNKPLHTCTYVAHVHM